MRQLTLDRARKPKGWGGWRPGAGRPRGRTKVAHERREPVNARHPLHVTLRAADSVSNLRRSGALAIVREAIVAVNGDAFRVVHFHVLANHIHMIVEADSARALARGMRGLGVRLARNLNALLGRDGALFAERFHARSLNTPTEVRNAIRYVLLNGDKHAKGNKRYDVDPYSSGASFDGWADERWIYAEEDTSAARPRTWLLREGWRKAGGPIAFDETPRPATTRLARSSPDSPAPSSAGSDSSDRRPRCSRSRRWSA